MQAKLIRCPPVALLESLLSERMDEPELQPLEAHVEHCTACQEQLEHMTTRAIACTGSARSDLETDPALDDAFLTRLKQLTIPQFTPTDQRITPTVWTGRVVADTPEPLVDSEIKQLGRYQILDVLGRGNMGVVYKALHTELGKIVALKVLPNDRTNDINIARFKNEARVMSRLDHPNIIAAYDAGRAEGKYFLVMSFVDGIDLARLLSSHGRFPIADACEIVRQAAVGMQHAHEEGLVHRDLKPSNLMLTHSGVVKVLDLGIARSVTEGMAAERLTATGALLGTADYLAPEQWDNPIAVDIRADVYSLGCTLYHFLTGRPPYSGPLYESILAKMRGHVDHPLPAIREELPEAPPALVAVLQRVLAKDPKDRYATPGEMAEGLKDLAAGSNLVGLMKAANSGAITPAGKVPSGADRDTDQSHRTLANSSAYRRGLRPLPVKRNRAATCAIFIILGGILGLFLWFIQHEPLPKKGPLKVETLTVTGYRDETAISLGDISTNDQPILANDSVRVNVRLSIPAYCYLIAFNPDGSEQLCYPEDAKLTAVYYPKNKDAKSMAMRPGKEAELQFPRDQYFEPGLVGLQVFVLIVSEEPLPTYAQWREKVGATPWKKTENYNQTWRWRYDGKDFVRFPNERGNRVDRGAAPAEFRQLCDFFRARPDVQMIHAWAFPVTKK